MIPTMILFGLVVGRWWSLTLILAAIVWPGLLVANGVLGLELALLGAAFLGVLNAAVGVGIHQLALWALRSMRDRNS